MIDLKSGVLKSIASLGVEYKKVAPSLIRHARCKLVAALHIFGGGVGAYSSKFQNVLATA